MAKWQRFRPGRGATSASPKASPEASTKGSATTTPTAPTTATPAATPTTKPTTKPTAETSAAPTTSSTSKPAGTKDAPTKDAPTKTNATKGAPAKDAPAKDASAKDASAKGTPAKDDAPAGDVLVAEAPPITEVPDDAIVVAKRTRRRLRDAVPVLLFRAAHPRQAALTALALGGAAAVAGRPAREAAVVLGTALVGQCIIGWHNDVVDARRDARHDVAGKPVADGRLDAGTVWYAIAVALLVLVPLSITTGITAGVYYLLSVGVAMLGHYVLRQGIWSWVPWAASFALLPAYLSYGGWGGQDVGSPPQTVMVVLAALLGVGVHLVRSVWGLVADHADGWATVPLRLGLRLGATRLLGLGTFYLVAVGVGITVAATQVGLSR